VQEPPRQTPADDAHRRLTEALQQAAQAGAHGGADHGAQQRDEPFGRRPAEPWHAPGNVVIEEGPPQLSAAFLPPPLPPTYVAAQRAADAFMPAPPTEIRRSQRRMPEVSDFPPVAQRAYHAMEKALPEEEAHEGASWPQHDVPRRRGLFERLATRVLGESDSRQNARADQAAREAGEGARTAASAGSRYGDGGARQASTRAEQEAELPEFFRSRRS
jgi:cell division protein FtsZ